MLQLPPPSYTPSSTDHNKISKFRAAIKLDISPAFIYSFSTKQGLHVSLSALQPTETTVCAHQELLKFFPHSSHLDCVSDGVFVAGLYAGHVSDYSPSLPCNMMAATTESVFLNLLVKNEPEDLTGHRERQVKIYFKIWSPAFCSDALFCSLYGSYPSLYPAPALLAPAIVFTSPLCQGSTDGSISCSLETDTRKLSLDKQNMGIISHENGDHVTLLSECQSSI